MGRSVKSAVRKPFVRMTDARATLTISIVLLLLLPSFFLLVSLQVRSAPPRTHEPTNPAPDLRSQPHCSSLERSSDRSTRPTT